MGKETIQAVRPKVLTPFSISTKIMEHITTKRWKEKRRKRKVERKRDVSL